MATPDNLPSTVVEVIRLLLAELPLKEQVAIAEMTESELVHLHFGLGMWLRNTLGLWGSNSQLLKATGQRHPVDASAVLVAAFWRRLREDAPRVQ